MSTFNINSGELNKVYDISGNEISSIINATDSCGYVYEPQYKSIPNEGNYRLVWHDEFDTPDINKSFWHDTHFISRVTNRYQAWTDYYLKNSYLHLRIKADAPNRYLDDTPDKDIAVSAIQTGEVNRLHMTTPFYHDINPFWGFVAQEGYWECRMKLFKGNGHTSWWTVGIQDGLNATSPRVEFDITETDSTATTKLPHGVHKWSDYNSDADYKTTDLGRTDLAEDFHTYGFLWENGILKWYLDGTLIDTMEMRTPQYPMMIFLAAYKRRKEAVNLGDVEFLVDYIRIYKKADTVSETPLEITSVADMSYDGNTDNMNIDSDRGCPLCFKSYCYAYWSDGSRTEHWIKWDATRETYQAKMQNKESFQWHGYVYGIGIDVFAKVNYESE